MKATIIKECTVVCEPGSIVEISEAQFAALGDAAQASGSAKAEPAKEADKKPAKKAKEKS